VKYAAINCLRQSYPISMLCELREVYTSGYHEQARRRARSQWSMRYVTLDFSADLANIFRLLS
jgi:hypothetical protein